MYEVLETLSSPSVTRWILQHAIRCDSFEEACGWAQRLSEAGRRCDCNLAVRYHVLAPGGGVLFSAG